MSAPSVLTEKLAEYQGWVSNIASLDSDTMQQYRSEIKLKGRNFIKFHAEVKLLNDDDLIAKFSTLMQQFRDVRDIANGRVPKPRKETQKAKSPKSPNPNPISNPRVCVTKSPTSPTSPCEAASAASSMLTDAELARQLQAAESGEPSARSRRARSTVTYIEDDDAESSSSEDDDDGDDEDFTEADAKRSYKRKIRSKAKEDARRKLEEATMDADELERIRKERLEKLLKKTASFMTTLTRRVRKNFKDSDDATEQMNSTKSAQLSTSDVREFLAGDNDKSAAIEQTQSLVGGTLKDYQRVGLRWMVTLNRMRLNGILADEMGLGKTVQVLALLAYILDNDGVRGKHLIVAPLSTLSSWRDHFADWLPSLRVYLHRGDPETRKAKLLEMTNGKDDVDVVVSTYQMVIRDAEAMSGVTWSYLIVDEAHTLKNAKGRLFAALNSFSTRHRLLLTGTPLQNNLGELWSLLNFILPAIFDSAQSFDSWFCSPFAHLKTTTKKSKKGKSAEPMVSISDEERLMVMDRLHRAIDPFLLRRMKKDVLPDLVKKEEVIIKCPMSGVQSAVYAQLQKYGALKFKGDTQRHPFNNVMMQLRQCANHPYLFAPQYEIDDDLYRSAGKFVLLRHLIPKMKRFGHRMLIFCQFVGVMDLVGELMDLLDEPYLRIDGSTDSEDRISSLETFNERREPSESAKDSDYDYSVFILSTRACGLGLNLWTADTVILFDSDWNPQQDLQAMARCHRIGQTREVRIFRLIADGTIEESIVDRAAKKLDLERKAIECGKFDFSISGKERKDFLKAVLSQRITTQNKFSSAMGRSKLNALLSRSEDEFKEFERMDANAEENGFASLLTDEALPSWLEEITTEKDAVEALPEKRRRTKVKSYNDLEYWKHIEQKCVEDEEDGEESKKGKKRKTRKRKRAQIQEGDEVEEEDGCEAAKKRRRTSE